MSSLVGDLMNNVSRQELAALESAVNDTEGIYCAGVPEMGFEGKLVAAGLMEPIDPSSINNYFFRITDAGREFVKGQLPPDGEW